MTLHVAPFYTSLFQFLQGIDNSGTGFNNNLTSDSQLPKILRYLLH